MPSCMQLVCISVEYVCDNYVLFLRIPKYKDLVKSISRWFYKNKFHHIFYELYQFDDTHILANYIGQESYL